MVNLIWLMTALVFIAMCLLIALLIYKWANNTVDRGASKSSSPPSSDDHASKSSR